jgi:tetratricopeptide (TPR) repeat protein
MPGSSDAADERPALVGRDDEREQIVRALEQAGQVGRGTLLLVTGEAGSGKSALAEAAAARSPVPVLWGRPWADEHAPPYHPWAQALRPLVEDGGPAAERVVLLQPGALEDGCDPGALRPLDGAARFQLFEAVRALLAERTRDEPLLLVLEDLHGADAPSLALLRYLAQELRGLRLVVLGTYRPREARDVAEADRLLADIAREGRSLPLRGLDPPDVAALLGEDPGDGSLARRLVAATGGNARFVAAMVEALRDRAPDRAASGPLASPLSGPLPLPDGLRTAVRQRLEPLGRPAVELLGAAAILGVSVEVGRLRALLDWDREPLLTALGACLDAGVIAEEAEHAGRYRFRHEVVQRTLLADLPAARRAALHLRAAEIIEQQHARDLDPHLDDLARHYRAGVPDELGRAREIVALAGQRAEEVLDWPRAARRWHDAVELAERAGAPQDERCDLLLRTGETLLRSGDQAAARGTYLEAARAARGLADWQRLARAALGVGGLELTPPAGIVDSMLVALLREALERLPDDAAALRGEVLARLALERRYIDPPHVGEALTREAVGHAERSGDLPALGRVLNSRQHVLATTSDPTESLANATQILEIARAANDPDLALQARTWRVLAFLALGDGAAVDRELAVHARLADSGGQPAQRWHTRLLRAQQALLEGRFIDAERLGDEALAEAGRDTTGLGPSAAVTNAAMLHHAHRFHLRRAQGRMEEVVAETEAMYRSYTSLPVWRCAMALLRLEQGRREEAAEELGRLAAAGFAAIPVDVNWLLAMTLLAEVASGLGDPAHARQLATLLEPHADRLVVVGPGAACLGTVTFHLGALEAAAGDHERAIGYLERALVVHERLNARPLAMRTRLALARSLGALGADPGRSADLLQEAHETALGLGLDAVAEETAAALAHGPPRTDRQVPTASTSKPDAARMSRAGNRWTLAFGGTVVQLRDSKGLRYLARLLSEPGADVPAALLEQEQRPEGPAGLEAARQRFDELRDDLAEAQQHGDRERVALTRERMAALAAALTADADRAEQARVNVTRALRTALRNVSAAHPDLGEHLQHALRTGAACSYRPDPLAPISWTVEPGDSA